jgi:hypothetical protein
LALLEVHPIFHVSRIRVNPLNAKLNPICHLLALLEAHHISHVSKIRVKKKLGKFWCIWVDNIKMDLQETLYFGLGWIHPLLLERARGKGRQQKRIQVG